ncbi:hypothetical protein Y032_0155g3092 [Ancylostoma ceylanicum]|uniref:Uncharacterized protein n=1 Tax=Ancylostoma ceylanicum TaxID=53326 RepID=A0A016SZN6_9BILA|nr:hypothetical protein Y032_0155g3092 [Ancylostoma ceylanicum]
MISKPVFRDGATTKYPLIGTDPPLLQEAGTLTLSKTGSSSLLGLFVYTRRSNTPAPHAQLLVPLQPIPAFVPWPRVLLPRHERGLKLTRYLDYVLKYLCLFS